MDAANSSGRSTHLVSFGLERVGLIALAHPWIVGLLIALLTGLAGLGIERLKVDDSLSELFRNNTEEFRQYEEIDKRFPSSEYDVLAVVEGPELLKKPQLEAFRNMTTELQLTDGVDGLVSMVSARGKPDASGYVPPIVPDDLPDGAAYDEIISTLRANEIVKGKFLSDDGELALVVISLNREIVAEQSARTVIGAVKGVLDQELGKSGLVYKLTGAPVMQLEIRNAVERDRLVYNGAGFLLGAIVAYVFYRRFSLMMLAVVPPLLAVIWSLGALGWLGFKLNLFLNVMTPLIMVMGFADSMQMTTAIRDRMRHGDSREEALRFGVRIVGPACVIAHGTALLSFIALMFSDSGLIHTFGMAGAISVLLSFFVVIAALPVIGHFLIRDASSLTFERTPSDGAMDALGRFVGAVVDRVVKHPVFFTQLGFGIF
jgi:predicted RND superfamily exporter protein